MKSPKLIFLIFVFLAVAITGGSLWYSSLLKTKSSDAASFGISPPYLNFENLKPGDEASASIRVMRGDTHIGQRITARFDELEVADWIEISPSETIVIEPGEREAHFNFKIKVPVDAYNEKHKGKLYFAISSDKKESGVGIALGARAEVDISVIQGRNPEQKKARAVSETTLAPSDLLDRLQGMFIMRVGALGQVYYIHPQEKKLFYLNSADDFLNLLKYAGRGINNDLLNKIPLDLKVLNGEDSDQDGLPNIWEQAIGTNIDKSDTDNDGFEDLEELLGNFSPFKNDKNMEYDPALTSSLAGFLLIQTESKGQVWYVDPKQEKRVLIYDLPRYLEFLKRYALGISEENYQKLFQKP